MIRDKAYKRQYLTGEIGRIEDRGAGGTGISGAGSQRYCNPSPHTPTHRVSDGFTSWVLTISYPKSRDLVSELYQRNQARINYLRFLWGEDMAEKRMVGTFKHAFTYLSGSYAD